MPADKLNMWESKTPQRKQGSQKSCSSQLKGGQVGESWWWWHLFKPPSSYRFLIHGCTIPPAVSPSASNLIICVFVPQAFLLHISVGFLFEPVWLHGGEWEEDLVLKAATSCCQVTGEGRWSVFQGGQEGSKRLRERTIGKNLDVHI